MPKDSQLKVCLNDEPDDRSDGGDKWAVMRYNKPRKRWDYVSLHRTKELATSEKIFFSQM